MKFVEGTIYFGSEAHVSACAWVEDNATDSEIESALLNSINIEYDWHKREEN